MQDFSITSYVKMFQAAVLLLTAARTGYGTMLIHSGTSIAAYDMEEDQVTAEDVIFFKAGKSPNYWDKEEKDCIKCSEVPERYFSEIMLQLTSVFGSKEQS